MNRPMLQAMLTCPQCRCESVSLPHARLLWVCGICGAPRIPVDLAKDAKAKAALAEPSADERRALLEAHRAAALAAFSTAGVVALVLTTIIPSFFAVLVGGHLALQVFLGALAGGLLLLAMVLHGRGKKARALIAERLQSAWTAAAGRVVEAKSGAITAQELADIVHTDPERAESLLVALSATDHVRIAPGDGLAFEATRVAADPVEAAETEEEAEPTALAQEPRRLP
jgi:hypothetical protein